MERTPDFNAILRRLAEGRTQKDLAADLGISEATMSRYIRGTWTVTGRTIEALMRLHPDLVLEALKDTNHEPPACEPREGSH